MLADEADNNDKLSSEEQILALKEELNTAKKEIEKHCQENDALKCEAIAIRA